MTSKYPGTCRLCGEAIKPGDQINWHGRGNAEHVECCEAGPDDVGEDAEAGLEPGTLANDRRLARSGLSVMRLASGASFTQNSRGRCEDAPCCGCCS